MRAWIVCLIMAFPLPGQSPAIRRPSPAGAAPPAQQLPADCGADGTVVNALTGQPLPRANVTPNTTNGSGTSTDAEGKWVISNITCGPVIFSAEKDGFIQNIYGRPAASLPTAGATTKPVTLTSSSTAHDLKIELMPEAVVTGRVVDDLGEPSSGAQVRIVRSMVQNGKRVTMNNNSTAADTTGAYRLGGLTAGRYFFCATSNRVRYPVGGGPPTVYGESCFPGPVSAGTGAGLLIEGGQEVHADFTLSQVTGVHIRGTLSAGESTNGRPMLPGMVQVFKTDANGFISSSGPVRPQQVRDGKFDIPNATPGSYILRANRMAGGEVEFANAFIEVNGSDVDGISLVFQPGATVSGTVKIENAATVAAPVTASAGQAGATGQDGQQPQDTSGKPMVNVNIYAIGFGGGMGRLRWDADHTSFSIPDVQSGKYRINVNVPGGGYFVKSVRLNDHEIRADGFSDGFMVQGPTGPIEIVVSNESGTLQGTVNDTAGNPAASQVIVQCGDAPVITGRSQDDGALKIQNVPAGACKAWAFDDGRNVEWADEEWMRRNAGSPADVVITSGSSAQVTLVRRVVPQ
ncbi:MAG TPA: carboxypeptidase regulatory-like domain-containing protein [Bryobacteraceae bacterium]|jgi:hypothetical protein|nr:carboxypeptidase regulatory-like domain-containing protein [Bryobacteraceae bacterium]